MKKTVRVEIEVRYAETDQMGVVHHSRYLPWFEIARTRLCETTGLPYAEIEERGYWLVVTAAEARYRSGARYGQTVDVSCRLERLATRGLRFAYEVFLDGRRIAEGATEHVWVDRSTGRHCRIPEFVREPFTALLGE